MAQIVNKFLAQVPATTLKGNSTGSTANVSDLSVATVQTMLSIPTNSSPLSLASGGTGISAGSANAAYNALSPMTTIGDLEYESATGIASRLPIGSTGQILTVVGGIPAWAAAPATGANTALSNLTATAVNADIVPAANTTTNLGALTFQWLNGWILRTQLHSTPDQGVFGLLTGLTGTPVTGIGILSTGDNTGNPNPVSVASANNSGSFNTSSVQLVTGSATGASNSSGNIILTTGSSSGGTAGVFKFLKTGVASVSGQVWTASATDGTGYWATAAVSGITQLTGDVTAGPGSGSQVATLATVNSNTGSFGSSTSIPSFTVNGKGLITAASGNAVVAPAGTLSGTTLNSTVVTSSLTSLGTQAQALNMGSFQINNLANGVAGSDAATYGQLQAVLAGLSWKNAVLVATTANITLSGEQTIDGFLTSSSRVLVKNQTLTQNNGIYVSGSGAWTRATDMNTWAEVPGTVVVAQEGTVNADLAFICTSAPGGTLGTTPITFGPFGTYLADGTTLTLTGNVFSITSGGVGTTQLASASVTAAKLATVTDGVTTNQSGSGSTIQSLKPVRYAYTLTSTDVTNQFVDLDISNGFPSNDPAYGTVANSVHLDIIGGGAQQEAVDYTINLTGGSSGSTRLSFIGGLATGGASALVSGDVLAVSYSYL
jgi:hypothetical protein